MTTGPAASGDRAGAFGSFHGTFVSGDRSSVTTFNLGDLPDPLAVRPRAAGRVPRPPRSLFVGREQELSELDQVLGSGSGVIGQTLKGLGGVGKSELALQYAHRHRAEFSSVWWLTADSATNLTTELATIAGALAPQLKVVPPEAAAQWALSWLQLNPGWLAVLDNVEHPDDIDEFLAAAAGSRVLVTTRRNVAGWQDRGLRSVHLGSLPADESIRYLAEKTRQDEPAAARSIAETLGGLPLALEQAAAYVVEMECGLAEYAALLAQEPEEAFGFTPPDASAQRQERAITRVWGLTLKALLDSQPAAVGLLDVLAWLGPDNLPRDLVNSYAGGDKTKADRMVSALRSYSMITLTRESVSVHRLVQAVLRLAQHERTETGIAPAAEAAVELLGNAIPDNPDDDTAGWPRWTLLLPHARALGEQVGGDNRNVALSRLLNQAGLFSSAQGMYSAAVTFATLALQIGRAAMGPSDPALATLLGNMGAAHHAAGHPELSAELEEQALAIVEAAYGPDSPHVALALSNLAGSYNALGRPDEAISLYVRALRISETAFGEESAEVALYLANLALAHSELGQTTEALPLEERALALTLRFNPDGLQVAFRLAALAASYRELGSPDRALELDRRAVTIGEKHLKDEHPEHPDLAGFYGGMASSHSALDEHEKALPLRERVLAIRRASLEEDHPDIASALGNLAATYQSLGRAEEAAALEEEALRITRASRGEDHPDTAARMSNLASTYRSLDRAGEALALDQQALVITQRRYGPDHRDVAIRLGSLAASLVALGRTAEAVPKLARALTIAQDTYGDTHPDIAIWSARLGAAYSRLGQHEAAARVYLTAMVVAQKALHPDHPDVARQLANRAGALNCLGLHREALPLLRRALRIEEIEYGGTDPRLLDRLDTLVDTCIDAGDLHQAARHQERYLALTITEHGPRSPSAATAHSRLGTLLFRQRRFTEAAVHEELALAITERHPEEAEHEVLLRLRLENLSITYQRLNAEADAIPLMQRVIELDEQTGMSDPAAAAQALSRLGTLMFRQGRLTEAAPLERRAVELTESDPGLLLFRLDNLAYTLDSLEENAELLQVRRRAYETAIALGESGDLLVKRLRDLAETCCELGYHDDADRLLREAVDIAEREHGRHSHEGFSGWNRLAATARAGKRWAAAEAASRIAVEIADRVLDPGAPGMLDVLRTLAVALSEQQRLVEAVPVQRRAVAAAEAAHGPAGLAVARQLSVLGNMYFRLGQPGNSIPLEERSLVITEAACPGDDAELLLPLRNLAASYLARGRREDAALLLRRALAIARRVLAPGDPEIGELESELSGACSE